MTPTEAPARNLPNGTPSANLFAKIKVRTVAREDLPARSFGKERTPGPFDELVGQAKASGETKLIDVPTIPGMADEDVRKKYISELHRSAELHEIGLDIWRNLEDGIAFVCRPKRQRTAK